ncbi:MAG: ADP-ribose pyrophosphatase [Glaciihabitans sp.]|nr:ADP-ribose pyrophosphatase [Glaciihabitans sp.]
MPEHSELRDEPLELAIEESEVAFKGRVWDVRRETFDYGGHPITREFVDHPGAVAVLALDENDNALLIQQYRHPIRMREWELPAGLLDVENEPPLDAARRELAEEADLVAEHWTELIDFHTSPGGSNEVLRIYLARGLSNADLPYGRAEEEADILVKWVPMAEIVAGILEHRLHNSILIVAVLAAHARA